MNLGKTGSQCSKLEMQPILVWRSLLDELDPTETRWRRLLVGIALFHGRCETWPERMRRARAVWPERTLNRPGVVTLASALLELEALGAIEIVDQVQDGFLVRLTAREETAA